jgi:hypothetical protein
MGPNRPAGYTGAYILVVMVGIPLQANGIETIKRNGPTFYSGAKQEFNSMETCMKAAQAFEGTNAHAQCAEK